MCVYVCVCVCSADRPALVAEAGCLQTLHYSWLEVRRGGTVTQSNHTKHALTHSHTPRERGREREREVVREEKGAWGHSWRSLPPPNRCGYNFYVCVLVCVKNGSHSSQQLVSHCSGSVSVWKGRRNGLCPPSIACTIYVSHLLLLTTTSSKEVESGRQQNTDCTGDGKGGFCFYKEKIKSVCRGRLGDLLWGRTY